MKKTLLLAGILICGTTAFAQLTGSTVTGVLQFGGGGNSFSPAGGNVPSSGYANSTNATVTLTSGDNVYYYKDIYNIDTADFDASAGLLTISDNMYGGSGATGWTMTFTDSAFRGVTNVSDSYINGGVHYSFAGDVISLSWGGSYSPSFVLNGTYTAVFKVSAGNVLAGHVYCTCDSNFIAGATVNLGTNSTVTDNNGAYAFTNVPPDTYTTTLSAPNYATLTTNLTVDGTATNDFYLTNSTLLINPIFDASVTNLDDYTTVSNTIRSAIQVYQQTIANPLCVTVKIAATNTGIASSYTHLAVVAYSDYFYNISHAAGLSANDILAQAFLPEGTNTEVNGNTEVKLTPANFLALGGDPSAYRAMNGGVDGLVWLNFPVLNDSRPAQDPTKFDLQAAVSHEFDEVLGIGGFGSVLEAGLPPSTNGVGPLDLFRFDDNGRSFTTNAGATAFFALVASEPLNFFNQNPAGDYGDWASSAIPQVQDAFGTPGAALDLGANEYIALDVVGYRLLAPVPALSASSYTSNQFAFTWPSLPGKTYQVQYATNFQTPAWTDLGDTITATGMTSGITDTNATGMERYYRVILEAGQTGNRPAVQPALARPAVAPLQNPPLSSAPDRDIDRPPRIYQPRRF